MVWDHAHNDYLEALLEGGILQFALVVAAVAFVFILAVRARGWTRDPRRQATILGGLAGFTTVVVHSTFDFGMHIPAIAVLATVLAAMLAGLGGLSRQPDAPPGQGVFIFRLNGAAPWLATAVLGLLALVLVGMGRRADLVDRSRREAQWQASHNDPGSRDLQVRYLRAAANRAGRRGSSV